MADAAVLSNEKPNRPWRDIAHELVGETNARAIALSEELNEALLAEETRNTEAKQQRRPSSSSQA